MQTRTTSRWRSAALAALFGGLVLVAASCAGSSTESVESVVEAPVEDLAEAPDDLAYAETPADPEPSTPPESAEAEPAEAEAVPEPPEAEPGAGDAAVADAGPEVDAGPPLCLALVPEDPEPDATGVVTYTLQGEWAQYSYGALYVIDSSGNSAFPSGEPAVRNGDSFTFVIDDSMRAADGSWTITTSIGGDLEVPCEYRITSQTSIAATSNGSVGY